MSRTTPFTPSTKPPTPVFRLPADAFRLTLDDDGHDLIEWTQDFPRDADRDRPWRELTTLPPMVDGRPNWRHAADTEPAMGLARARALLHDLESLCTASPDETLAFFRKWRLPFEVPSDGPLYGVALDPRPSYLLGDDLAGLWQEYRSPKPQMRPVEPYRSPGPGDLPGDTDPESDLARIFAVHVEAVRRLARMTKAIRLISVYLMGRRIVHAKRLHEALCDLGHPEWPTKSDISSNRRVRVSGRRQLEVSGAVEGAIDQLVRVARYVPTLRFTTDARRAIDGVAIRFDQTDLAGVVVSALLAELDSGAVKCAARGCPHFFTPSHTNRKYCEDHVGSKQRQEEYRKRQAAMRPARQVSCAGCAKTFETLDGRVRYCPDCRSADGEPEEPAQLRRGGGGRAGVVG